MLFVQGSRDAFGTPAELQPIISQLEPAADLFVVEGGDHSFKVPKSAGVKQQDVYRAIQDRIETWLRMIVVQPRLKTGQDSATREGGTAPRSRALRASH